MFVSFYFRQQLYEIEDKSPQGKEDVFHFIAYLPIKGRLYELDGLKPAPIDLGAIPEGVDWTKIVRPVLEKRIMKYSEGEIHFNLMAIVSDRKMLYERELKALVQTSTSMDTDELNIRVKELESLIDDEDRKRLSYKKENIRRKHNNLPLIIELLTALAEEKRLVEAVKKIKEKKKPSSIKKQ